MTDWPENGLPDTHDPHVAAWLRRLLRPDDVFYDLGANRGIFSAQAAKAGATVVAFEPLPSACVALGNVLGHDGKHTIVCAAAWDRYTPLVLRLDPESGRCEVGEEAQRTPKGLHRAAIFTVGMPLDGLVPEWDVPLPTILKSDTQGSEVRWLFGAKNALGACRALILECVPPMLARNGSSEEELMTLLHRYGFRVTDRSGSDLLVER